MQRGLASASALLAVVLLSACSQPLTAHSGAPYFQPAPVELEVGDVFPMLTIYGGWWSTLAISPETAGYPLRVALIRPETGEYLGGYDRLTGSLVIGEDFRPIQDWPKNAVLVIDASTGVVWDWFRVDEEGTPVEAHSGTVSVERRFPPIAGSTPPGSAHMFVRNEFTGAVIYVGVVRQESEEDRRAGLDW